MNDRELLQRAYALLTMLRVFTDPRLWTDEPVALYLEIEAHLNQPRTGTIRAPLSEREERRRQVASVAARLNRPSTT